MTLNLLRILERYDGQKQIFYEDTAESTETTGQMFLAHDPIIKYCKGLKFSEKTKINFYDGRKEIKFQ